MTIVPINIPETDAREEVVNGLMLMIDEAASSRHDVDPYTLAAQILTFIEKRIHSAAAGGEVLYYGYRD
jgi:hypothetical protein